jgi:hypothetical protein
MSSGDLMAGQHFNKTPVNTVPKSRCPNCSGSTSGPKQTQVERCVRLEGVKPTPGDLIPVGRKVGTYRAGGKLRASKW